MDERSQILRSNLKLMYRGEFILAISMLFVIIPLINLFAVLAALVGAIMSVVGMVKLRNEHPDYMNAVIALVINFIAGLFDGGEGGFSSLMGVISSVAGLFMVYFVIRATNQLLREIGAEAAASAGDKAWKYQIGATITSIVCSVLSLVLFPLALVFVIISIVVALAALVYYVRYLDQASSAF